MTLLQQIGRTQAALRSAKPRSRRRVELESRLRSLMTRQIRVEILSERQGRRR